MRRFADAVDIFTKPDASFVVSSLLAYVLSVVCLAGINFPPVAAGRAIAAGIEGQRGASVCSGGPRKAARNDLRWRGRDQRSSVAGLINEPQFRACFPMAVRFPQLATAGNGRHSIFFQTASTLVPQRLLLLAKFDDVVEGTKYMVSCAFLCRVVCHSARLVGKHDKARIRSSPASSRFMKPL